jgi:hypothetical protein
MAFAVEFLPIMMQFFYLSTARNGAGNDVASVILPPGDLISVELIVNSFTIAAAGSMMAGVRMDNYPPTGFADGEMAVASVVVGAAMHDSQVCYVQLALQTEGLRPIYLHSTSTGADSVNWAQLVITMLV